MIKEDFFKLVAIQNLFSKKVFTYKEIGKGNMNFVYQILDFNVSYALKYAPPYLRMLGKDFPLTQKRVIAEMNSMEYFHSLAPDFIPQIYLKNEQDFFFVMEYLDGYVPLREQNVTPLIYEKLGEFLFALSSHAPNKNLYYACDELKQITKSYVFEYPFIKNHEALVILEYLPAQNFSQKFLDNLQKFKTLFLSPSQTLIHGDLHTDSIMIKENNLAIIDSEFALFSDVSFDIGNLIAHTLFHSIANKDKEYENKLEALFSKLKELQNFSDVLQNSVGFCAIEMMRRLYVPAKSKDLESVEDVNQKQKAYELSFELAHFLLEEYQSFQTPESLLKKLQSFL